MHQLFSVNEEIIAGNTVNLFEGEEELCMERLQEEDGDHTLKIDNLHKKITTQGDMTTVSDDEMKLEQGTAGGES